MSSAEKETPKMDSLLAKLRKGMAELSLQGDDFTRQMCHMYAIFEEVVGEQLDHRQPQKAPPSPPFLMNTSYSPLQKAILPLPPLKPVKPSKAELQRREDSPTRQALRTTYLYGSPGVRRKRMSGLQASKRHQRSRSEPSANPLLDTISVLTCDSDEYFDLTSVYQQPRNDKRLTGDVDSIGYAGSNSIDSGYKSLCPTPEIPESTYYGNESSGSSSSSPNRDKPKILMGTKVMMDKCHKPHRIALPPPPTRRSDLDVNLDHLMYLRQSLISAIQKCESSSQSSRDSSPCHHVCSSERPASPVVLHRTSSAAKSSPHASPRFQRRHVDCQTNRTIAELETTSSCTSPSKTVRFDPDNMVKVAAGSRSPRPNRKQSKSILKDPLCASIRSHLSADAPDSTFEEEIDALLYGKAEYYDLESVQDFPCSYVTMIEEKYRSGKSSVAKVKKLKDSVPPQPEPVVYPKDDKPAQQQTEGADDKTKDAKSGSTKFRFTEVAKCMLEIIEDIQCKKQNGKTTEHPQDQRLQASSKVTKPEPSDYHVYEEIMYDFVAGGAVSSSERPPPLPARPSGIFPKYHHVPHRNILYGRNQQNFRANTYGGNRPKQRSNLYSLFSDQVERRHLSQSLEQEWKVGTHHGGPEDDYGFRRVFPAL